MRASPIRCWARGRSTSSLINGPASHVELIWEEPATARSFEQPASFSRLLLFGRRGTGLSDPVSRPPTLEQQMDDLCAVLDAVGVQGQRSGAPAT
jgi:pimeloyl-ACP methyl ester carboxylesterase